MAIFRQRARTATAALLALTVSVAGSFSARAETINVNDNHGGSVAQYDARWAGLAARGVDVRIVGPCQSACTVLLGHIPRNKICVTERASFGFHQANLPAMTTVLWNAYQGDIKSWINAHGGLKKDFVWMRAPDVFRYFKRCGAA